MQTCALRFATGTALAALLICASPAAAQYKPRPLNDPATGEKWHIEGAADFWFPSAEMVVEKVNRVLYR